MYEDDLSEIRKVFRRQTNMDESAAVTSLLEILPLSKNQRAIITSEAADTVKKNKRGAHARNYGKILGRVWP